MAVLRLELDGRRYTLDSESVTSLEYRTIKAHTGLSISRFWAMAARYDDMEAEVVDILRWLFRKRAGEVSDFDPDDEYPAGEFLIAWMAAVVRHAQEVAAAAQAEVEAAEGPKDEPATSTSERPDERSSSTSEPPAISFS